ncbi:hypothetical protein AB5I41_11265 [Sphingomonas sp. MMS24-JH45]
MPLMPGTQSVDVDKKGGPLPVTGVSAAGGRGLHQLVRRRPPHPLEHGADAVSRPTPHRCSRAPQADHQVPGPAHRRVAADGGAGRQPGPSRWPARGW